jgi:DNA-binding LytR/AlgR family response regulator
MIFNILIVDDEQSGRVSLHILLEKLFVSFTESIKIAKSFNEAELLLKDHVFQLVFLDINLKGFSAFDLLPNITPNTKVIFVTAYSEFVYKALRGKAFDYLLKPIKEEELRECLERIKKEEYGLNAVIHVKQNGNSRILNIRDILFIEADGPYSKIHLKIEVIVIARTLKSVLEDLGDAFIRNHKTYAVNQLYIKSFNSNQLLLNNERCLPVSRKGFRELSAY